MSNAIFSKLIQILFTNSKVLVKVAKNSWVWAEVIWKRPREKRQRELAVGTLESSSKKMFPASEGLTIKCKSSYVSQKMEQERNK